MQKYQASSMRKYQYLATLCSFVLLSFCLSCNSNTVYRSHQEIKDGLWYAKDKPEFTVNIEDTTARYNVYYLLRTAIQYPYYNLYLTRKITDPDQQVLAYDLVELKVSDEITGKPYGKGLGDLFDQKIPFLKNYEFKRRGSYTFEIGQSMRQDPLPFVMSIGISVEKVEP